MHHASYAYYAEIIPLNKMHCDNVENETSTQVKKNRKEWTRKMFDKKKL